jgi:hypothetical protein
MGTIQRHIVELTDTSSHNLDLVEASGHHSSEISRDILAFQRLCDSKILNLFALPILGDKYFRNL